MLYNQIAGTDLAVSRICLGTMTFGEQNSESEAHQQLDYAVSQGINFIDSAEMYSVPGKKETQGLSETYIGNWLKKHKRRENLVVATKITGPSKEITWIRNPMKFSAEQLRKALKGSLERLQTDYIDLYQLHWPERRTNFFGRRGYLVSDEEEWENNFQEILETIKELIREGKVRYFGLSNETPWGLMDFLIKAQQFDLPQVCSIQNPFNLLNRTCEIGLAEIVHRNNISFLAYSPLAFGLLSGKYHNKTASNSSRLNQFKQMDRYNSDNSWQATKKYIEIAERFNITPTQLALGYIGRQRFVTSTIIGATNLEQLKENIDTIHLGIPPSILAQVDEIHEEIPNPAP